MSIAADRARLARRLAAAPGSRHDRIVRAAAVGLPALVGVVLAVMVVLPLTPQAEVSFLLDRNRVATTTERVAVHNATYRGEDDQGRSFALDAGAAVQRSAVVPVVTLSGIVGHMALQDGTAQVTAPGGDYHIDTEQMVAAGPVRFATSSGYTTTTSAVTIDLRRGQVVGAGGITGTTPQGRFSADRISLDLASRTLHLSGHAHMVMVPGAHGVTPGKLP